MTRVFAGRHDQVACARAFVRTALGPVSVVDEAVLLVSELCTNALLHTASGYDGTFEVAVYLGSLSVRIEVRDGGAAMAPSVRQPVGTFAEYGRGLNLVELLSDRWGYSGESNGRSVFLPAILEIPRCRSLKFPSWLSAQRAGVGEVSGCRAW